MGIAIPNDVVPFPLNLYPLPNIDRKGDLNSNFKMKLACLRAMKPLILKKIKYYLVGVRNFFKCVQIVEKDIIDHVTYQLKGGALAWWTSVQHESYMRDDFVINSWSIM